MHAPCGYLALTDDRIILDVSFEGARMGIKLRSPE